MSQPLQTLNPSVYNFSSLLVSGHWSLVSLIFPRDFCVLIWSMSENRRMRIQKCSTDLSKARKCEIFISCNHLAFVCSTNTFHKTLLHLLLCLSLYSYAVFKEFLMLTMYDSDNISLKIRSYWLLHSTRSSSIWPKALLEFTVMDSRAKDSVEGWPVTQFPWHQYYEITKQQKQLLYFGYQV